MDNLNIFAEPKALKNWAIQLANSLGGQTVTKGPLLSKVNMKKVDTLIEKFVQDYNFNIRNSEEE